MQTPTQRIRHEISIPGDSYGTGAINSATDAGWITRGTAERGLGYIDVSNVGASGQLTGVGLQYRKKQADGTFGSAVTVKDKDGNALTLANITANGKVNFDLFFNETSIAPEDQFRYVATVANNAVKLSGGAVLVDFAEEPPMNAHTNALAAKHGPPSREPTANNP